MTDSDDSTPNDTPLNSKISRRAFLIRGSSLIAATTVASATLVNCGTEATPAPAPTPVIDLDDKYLHVAPAPTAAPVQGARYFFTPEEYRLVESITARLLPGDAADPGAREMGVATYIDYMLATHPSYARPTYIKPPFVKTYDGDTPPPEAANADPAKEVWVSKDEIGRYGWQQGRIPQELYRLGLAHFDRYVVEQTGSGFADLPEETQDSILESFIGDATDGDSGYSRETFETAFPESDAPDDLSAGEMMSLFKMIHQNMIEGVFSDPLYGGNRNLAGWKLIGYPGAQRAYTPQDLMTEDVRLQPQSLAHLSHFHPGLPVNESVVLPLAGSDQQREETINISDPLEYFKKLFGLNGE
jgi:gluconate 2-dehydrogenase gamma chain